ncbi:hypothetical protein ABEB36_009607 [Hypothenemus hampei]|uniref:Uncharacterized protein n=1 Tax=Hypothenemus hampei TaxID=57062 RepID=A0ABD1EHH9_HYPHA
MINESGKEKRKETKSAYIENKKKVKEQGVVDRDLWAMTLQENNKENCVNVVNLESDIICDEQCLQFAETTDIIILEDEAKNKGEKSKEEERPSEIINMPGSSQPQVAGPIWSRARRMNVQKHGLLYLKKYDRQQIELRKKELQLEESYNWKNVNYNLQKNNLKHIFKNGVNFLNYRKKICKWK